MGEEGEGKGEAGRTESERREKRSLSVFFLSLFRCFSESDKKQSCKKKPNFFYTKVQSIKQSETWKQKEEEDEEEEES